MSSPTALRASIFLMLVSSVISGCASSASNSTHPTDFALAVHLPDSHFAWNAAPQEGTSEAADLADDLEDPDEFGDFDEFDEVGAEGEEVFDPLSGFNRGVYHFNDKFYLWVWEPTAKGYRYVLPEPVRIAINNGYENFQTPHRLLNALLQLKGEKAGIEIGRFLTNSTLGVGGLFDAAEYLFELKAPSPEDFGQTLGYYGVGEGFPLVLPLLGPSNLRDGVGRVADSFSQPVAWFIPLWMSASVTAFDYFNYSSLHIGEYQSVKSDALDPYTLFRDAYHQQREKLIQE